MSAASSEASSATSLPSACLPDITSTRCDDGLACTAGDACIQGVCTGTSTCPAWLPACGAQGCTCPLNAACSIGNSAGTCTAEGRCFVRVERGITADEDDAEQEAGGAYENFNFLETNAVGDRVAWYFRNVDLVPRSTVAGAWLRVLVDNGSNDRFAADLLGLENSAAPMPPEAANNPLLLRTVTGARAPWGGRLTGGINTTPDFSPSVQELVDGARVVPGMNLLVIMERQAAVQLPGGLAVQETDSLQLCAHENGNACSAVLVLSVLGPAN